MYLRNTKYALHLEEGGDYYTALAMQFVKLSENINPFWKYVWSLRWEVNTLLNLVNSPNWNVEILILLGLTGDSE